MEDGESEPLDRLKKLLYMSDSIEMIPAEKDLCLFTSITAKKVQNDSFNSFCSFSFSF